MKGLSFISDGEVFAVDVTLVQQVSRNLAVTPVPTAPNPVVGIANIKGRVVTVLSLTELFGQKKRNDLIKSDENHHQGMRSVYVVIFKSAEGSGDQMGLLIDKPGNLIEIDEEKIFAFSGKTDSEEKFCLSGMAEIDGRLYRIINIDAIINYFKNGGENKFDTPPQL